MIRMRRLITPNGYYWQSNGDKKRLFSIYANLGGPDTRSGDVRSAPKKQVYQAETA